METLLTKIKDLICFKPQVYLDTRGSFFESWRKNKYHKTEIGLDFVQDNFSYSQNNVLRGLHFQIGELAQGQMVSIVSGRVFDVCLDVRTNSKTFSEYEIFELDANNPMQIYMPPGIAHGFYVLSEKAILHYKCTQYYSPTHESGIIWNDLDINIPWPCKKPIVSDKDQKNINFRDLSNKFGNRA